MNNPVSGKEYRFAVVASGGRRQLTVTVSDNPKAAKEERV